MFGILPLEVTISGSFDELDQLSIILCLEVEHEKEDVYSHRIVHLSYAVDNELLDLLVLQQGHLLLIVLLAHFGVVLVVLFYQFKHIPEEGLENVVVLIADDVLHADKFFGNEILQ